MISWISVFEVIFELVIGILLLLLNNQNNFITCLNRLFKITGEKTKIIVRNVAIISLTLATLSFLRIIFKIFGG